MLDAGALRSVMLKPTTTVLSAGMGQTVSPELLRFVDSVQLPAMSTTACLGGVQLTKDVLEL
jgi:hypothetical protein